MFGPLVDMWKILSKSQLISAFSRLPIGEGSNKFCHAPCQGLEEHIWFGCSLYHLLYSSLYSLHFSHVQFLFHLWTHPAGSYLITFAIAISSAWNTPDSSKLVPSDFSSLCSNVTFSVRPALTTLYQAAAFLVILYPIISLYFLYSANLYWSDCVYILSNLLSFATI